MATRDNRFLERDCTTGHLSSSARPLFLPSLPLLTPEPSYAFLSPPTHKFLDHLECVVLTVMHQRGQEGPHSVAASRNLGLTSHLQRNWPACSAVCSRLASWLVAAADMATLCEYTLLKQ